MSEKMFNYLGKNIFISSIVLAFLSLLFFTGCNNNNKVVDPTYEEARKENPKEIAVNTAFVPTIEITQELEHTSLDDLIIKVYNETHLYKDDNPMIHMSSFNFKYVPANSKLAKAYLLEDTREFIRLNKDYYHKVISAYHNTQKKIREQSAQDAWNDYL